MRRNENAPPREPPVIGSAHERSEEEISHCEKGSVGCGTQNHSLEDAFWGALKEIAANRNVRVSDLIATINKDRQHPNLSSAQRLFVLDHYRAVAERRADHPNATS